MRALLPTLTFTLAALVLPALAAPDEEFLGKSEGYPLCQRGPGVNLYAPRCMISSVSRFDEIFPARKVAKAAEPVALKRAAAEPKLRLGHVGSLDYYLGSNRTTGLLILKEDTILVDRYQYERTAAHRMNSFSMAKTLTAMLVGIALEEKLIQSIDDRADQYVAELKATVYGETPIRHLLSMSSGIQYVESNDPPCGDNATLGRLSMGRQSPGGAATVAPFSRRAHAPGERYNYASADTQVLGLVLRAATGKTLADYLAEKIWQPMGAESYAFWSIDAGGYETAYMSFHATVRDYARIGMLLANGGAINGRQLVPAAWVREMTRPQTRYRSENPRYDPYNGYGYQTWLIDGGRYFAALGFRGQAVYVDPKSKVVMVHTAAREHRDPGHSSQASLWHAVAEQFSKSQP